MKHLGSHFLVVVFFVCFFHAGAYDITATFLGPDNCTHYMHGNFVWKVHFITKFTLWPGFEMMS